MIDIDEYEKFDLTITCNQVTKKFSVTEFHKERFIRDINKYYKERINEIYDETYSSLVEELLGRKLKDQIYTHNEEGEEIAITSSTRKITRPTIIKIIKAFEKRDWHMEFPGNKLFRKLKEIQVNHVVQMLPLIREKRNVTNALENIEDVDITLLWDNRCIKFVRV